MLSKIILYLERLMRKKFSGEIVLRIYFNQGGIRSVKAVQEEKQDIG